MIKGLGIDAVDIERFRAVLDRQPGLVNRLFSESERAYASKFEDPVPRLSARFAAKEATMKALGVGVGAFKFSAVSVVNDDGGVPTLHVEGEAQQLAVSRGISHWLVSLTHTDLVAEAVVIGQ